MLKTGTMIGGTYKILDQIGQGGMSVVYLAINEKANKTWAVKELRQEAGIGSGAVRERLLAETELLKRMRHPRLPTIVDVIDEKGNLLIVMDYIEGNSLKEVLAAEGAQPQERVIAWGKQLCEVLAYLHGQDPPIIYRDMKPANIMLQPDGSVKLIDFGAARELCSSDVREDTICLGTPGYAAPEQWGGCGQTDPRTDIYCLGATLFHLATGREPAAGFGDRLTEEVKGRELSGGFQEVLEKCTRREPKERFQNCQELAYALEHYEEMDECWRKNQRRRFWGFAVTLLMSLVFLGTALGAWGREQKLAWETYEAYLERALSATEEKERIDAYEQAVSLNPGREEGYLALLEQVFLAAGEEGSVSFTKEEDALFRKLLNREASDGRTFEMHLKGNPAGYERLAYALGLAYYYDYEAEGNKNYAVKWLNAAAASQTLPEACRERALRLGKIGEYYSRIGQRNRAGDLAVSYSEYWEDLTVLARGNLLQKDNAVTALRMYQELASQIHSRTLEFRQAGIEREELEEQLFLIQTHLREDFTETDWEETGLDKMRRRLEELLLEAKRQVAAVYDKKG